MKKKQIIAGLLAAASLLSGCGYRTVEDMYQIPRRAQEYTLLQSTIEQAMVGLTFASPTYGIFVSSFSRIPYVRSSNMSFDRLKLALCQHVSISSTVPSSLIK